MSKAVASHRCPRCRAGLAGPQQGDSTQSCPVCAAEVSSVAFPRAFGDFPSSGSGAAALPASGDAVCRFFPDQKAEKVCDECGAFLSEKAAVNWQSAVYCMPCLHALRNQEKNDGFTARRTLHDRLALALVTWGFPFSFFTAPIALFLLIRYRNAPRGVLPRGKTVWWVALVLSSLLTLFWVGLVTAWLGSKFVNI